MRWLWMGLAVAAPLVVLEPRLARAQDDDWSLTREPRGTRPAPTRGERPRRPPSRVRSGTRPPARAQPQALSPQATGEDGRADLLIQRYLRVLEADPQQSFALRRLLDLYRERDGNIDRLVEELSARASADETAYAPRMLLGHVQRAQNRADEARASYRRAAELRPTDAAPLVALAQIERSAGASAEARRLYEQALERTRERLAREELLREVAQLAMESGELDEARRHYEELARGADRSIYLRTEYARALSAARHFEQAVAEYERVIRALRGDNRVLPPVLLELSRAELETGEVEASIGTLDRALRSAGAQAGIRAEIYDQMLTAYRRTDRLSELAERLRREARGGFESSELLGRIEDELGNDEAALEAYRRALRGRPADIDTRVRIIQLLTRSGRLEDVVEEYRALIRSAPREPRFVIELAQLLMQTDHREDALRLVRETGQRNPRDPVIHQQLAELYSRWGEDALAAREVELLARIDPNDPAHVIALGDQQFTAGQRDAALVTWRRVLSAEADRAAGHATLGGILADHDMLPEAIAAYQEAVRLDPDELSYVRGLATALERNRDDDAAEQQWRRALDLSGDDRAARREARERIVGIWSRTRQLPARIQELERRFGAEPPDAEAGRFLAEAYRRRGPQHQADAERVLERIIQIEPGDVETLLALERMRTRRGDLAGAIDVLALLRDADTRRAAQYLQRMAEHALALYRDEEAVRYAAEAVQRNPDDASAHRRLADLYRARQDVERAVTSYRRALELNDRLYPVYFELAELYLARGETQQADRLYRQVLRSAPDDDLVARAARASSQINLGAGTLPDLERDLLPLALSNPQRSVFRRMVVELYDAYAGPLAARARRGGGEAARARGELRSIGTRGIKPLLEALADQDPSQRRVALEILGDLGNPSAAAPLLALAENASLDIGQRTQALLAAGAVAAPALVPRFDALARGPERRLQGIAAWGLARIGGREGLRALRRLSSSGEAAVRAYAAVGLGLHGGASEAAELERLLREDSNEDVVFAAAWGLGRAGDERQVPSLVRVLEASGGPAAAVAAGALGELGGDAAIAALVRALFSPDAAVRSAAAPALSNASRAHPARGGRLAAGEADGAGAGHEPERREPGASRSRERRSAPRAAARERGEEAPARPSVDLPPPESAERVREYVSRLADVRASDRVASVESNGTEARARSQGAPVADLSELVPLLELAAAAALAGPVEQILAALDVLSSRATGVGLGPLTDGLEAWPDGDRSSAEQALAVLADALADEIVGAAGHLDAAVRVEAVRLLVRLEHPQADAAVAVALAEPPASVQRAALDALGSVERAPSAAIAERLATILRSDRDWSMRTRSARALAPVTTETAREALREALRADSYAFVREAAASALGRAPSAEDVAPLEHALSSDGEPRVRAAAVRALVALGGDVAERARERAASDASPVVREAAGRVR